MALLEIRRLTYQLGNRNQFVRVSTSLPKAGVLLIQGPSGSGKTTLLRILGRLQDDGGGEIFYHGQNWRNFAPARWRVMVHYLAQKPALFDGTVLDNLTMPFTTTMLKKDHQFDRGQAVNLLERLLLPGDLLERDARTLSGGEAARVALIRSLLIAPAILLLDEPMAALDSGSHHAVKEVLLEWVNGQGGCRGLVLVSHVDNAANWPGAQNLDILPGIGEGG